MFSASSCSVRVQVGSQKEPPGVTPQPSYVRLSPSRAPHSFSTGSSLVRSLTRFRSSSWARCSASSACFIRLISRLIPAQEAISPRSFLTGTPRARMGCQWPSTPRKRCSISQTPSVRTHSFPQREGCAPHHRDVLHHPSRNLNTAPGLSPPI